MHFYDITKRFLGKSMWGGGEGRPKHILKTLKKVNNFVNSSSKDELDIKILLKIKMKKS